MKQIKISYHLILAVVLAAPPPLVLAEQNMLEAKNMLQNDGQYINDVLLTEKIRMELLRELGLKGSDINIIVDHGNVELHGTLESQSEVDRAIKTIKSIEGLESLENHINVK